MDDFNYKIAFDQAKKIIKKDITCNASSSENIGYSNVYKGWVTVISCDIRKYKELCLKNDITKLVKIIQIYSTNIITIGKLSDNYMFSSLNGDEVILVYKTRIKANNEILSIAIWINTFKSMFKKLVKEQLNIDIDFGIGVAGKFDQIIVKYGKKYNTDDNELTVIGSVINEACALSKFDNNTKILVTNLFKDNCLKQRNSGGEDYFERYSGNMESILNVNDIWSCDFIMTNFNNWINKNFNDS